MERIDQLIEKLSEEVDVKPKRIVKDGFEQESRLEPVKPDLMSRGERRRQALRKKESTAGPLWYNMPVRELSVEDKLTLDALKLRETIDPGKFYKKKATDNISKHFQIGKIIEDPIDFYSGRATRRETRPTLVDELIADTKFKQTVKKRYSRIKYKKLIDQRTKRIIEKKRKFKKK